jgi:lipopolysaccharide/colanic/teichoic acid biosynthesis glycosyltransferase
MRSKRVLDLTLLLLASPLLLTACALCALLVLLGDGRPVLFVQTRLGLGRRPFRVFKLRTMTCETDPRHRRPTPLGTWLRQRGLDELPQLWNVARGEMSLVGPRPLHPEDAARLEQLHSTFGARFESTPGLTGLAQVCQARGAKLTARLDARYARERNAAMDLAILFRTAYIHLVGKRRGARALPRGPA